MNGIFTPSSLSSNQLNSGPVAVLTQPDGKFILVNNSIDTSYFQGNSHLTRYNADGTVDSSFASVKPDIGAWSNYMDQTGFITSAVLQNDGKIVVAGYSGISMTTSVTNHFIIGRFNADGSVDTTYGNNGGTLVDMSYSTGFSAPPGARAYGIALQADEKVVVVGQSKPFTYVADGYASQTVALARFNVKGTIDTSFGINTSLNATQNILENATIRLDSTVQVSDPDLLAPNNYNGASVTLARHGGPNPDDVFIGSNGLSFADGNVSFYNVYTNDGIVGTYVNAGGKLTITFNSYATNNIIDINNPSYNNIVNQVLSRISYSNSSDTPDPKVQIDWTFSDGNAGAQGMGGALTTVGSTTVNIAAVNDAPTFSLTGGYVFTAFPYIGLYSASSSSAVSMQSDGKILVTGSNGYDLTLVRYNSNGTLDTSFDGDGKITTNFGNSGGGYPGISNAITVQPDGKILIAGTAGSIARYNTDGSLDNTFSGDGKVVDNLLPQSTVANILLQSDGKILVSGGFHVGPNADNFGVVRYNSDGTLDTTFGVNGLASTYVSIEDQVADTVIQADGKILVVGTSLVGGASRDFVLVRYNANGTLDSSFDGDGKVTTAVGAFDDFAKSVALQTDGKIVVGGTSHGDFALTRYNANGGLDISFSGDGKVTLDLGATDTITAIALQSDGKILAAGNIYFDGTRQDVALVRYNADGTLDSTFANNGKLITNFGAMGAYISDIVIQADGKIVVSGGSSSQDIGKNDAKIIVSRFNADGSIDSSFDDPGNNINESTVNNFSFYNENASPVVLDGQVSLYDAELSALNNFNGSSVTLARQGGANVQDLFSGSGNLVLSGGSVQLSGVVIGSLSNTNGALSITFNNNATQAKVNEALSSIAYSNSSDAPPASVQINWKFNDGNTGAQGTGSALNVSSTSLVTIYAVNDQPVLTGTKAT